MVYLCIGVCGEIERIAYSVYLSGTQYAIRNTGLLVQILALDHIQIAMPPGQEAEARRFYGEVLGLTEVAKPAAFMPRGGCWFEGQGVVVHLGVQENFVPARKAHPAFSVANLAECRRALEAAGAPIIPDDALPHVRRFHTADPFGNRIEFIQAGDSFDS